MTELDLLLRNWLPRPAPEPRFRDHLEELILAGGLEGDELAVVTGTRRRIYVIGGAVAGAAALAVGAAVGWLRLRGPRARDAA